MKGRSRGDGPSHFRAVVWFTSGRKSRPCAGRLLLGSLVSCVSTECRWCIWERRYR